MAAAELGFVFLVLASASALSPPKYSACDSKDFGHGGTVCVCSSEHCDGFSEGEPLASGEYAVYTSSKAGKRFHLDVGKFGEGTAADGMSPYVITVNGSARFQKILGFGGAFTDAAALNILNVTAPLQQALLASYFSARGIEYTVGRVPMASCDFSTREYSYDDYDGDFALDKFTLAAEDLKFKIPVIRAALNMSRREIALFGSPWSAPGWMKTSGKMTGYGHLKGEAGDKYHKSWALYFAKFLEAYAKNDVKLWGITVQNEPSTGFIPGYSFQCMGFTAEWERDFIKSDLGPTLAQLGHADVKIMMLDDQRLFLPQWADVILSDKDAAKYVSGIGVHWYWDNFAPASNLEKTHERHPDVFILATEACTGSEATVRPRGVSLGDWSRGNAYSHSIIEDLTHWAAGWVDWNLALNMEGGPNWVRNFVDSPIIVDADHDVFYKQPMFYHLGHFSKFVPPGSSRISVQAGGEETPLQFVGFLCPDSSIVLVMLNDGDVEQPVLVVDSVQGQFAASIPASSIQTFVWTSKKDRP